MLCGNAAMEVDLSATKTAATRFQMQVAINANRLLPFPTPAEKVCLLGAYDSSGARGYLKPQQYRSLAKQMQVPASSVRQWFTEERMRQGHQGDYQKYPSQPKKRGRPPTVEVRTKLPLQRWRQPSTSHAPEDTRTMSTPEPKGEYYKEETPQEVKMSVMWASGLDKLTMYAFDPEAQEITTAPQEATHHVLSDTGAESQDSGLGYAELEVKEHPIEGGTATLQETRRKISPRDPRRHSVTLASPSSLYGMDTPPVPDSPNVAPSTQRIYHATDSPMEESDGEPPLVINIVNIESE